MSDRLGLGMLGARADLKKKREGNAAVDELTQGMHVRFCE